MAYVDQSGRLQGRRLHEDGSGRPTSETQLLSGELRNVREVGVAAGDSHRNQFGVVFIADAPGQLKGLYFVGVNEDATPVSAPVRLSPQGADVVDDEDGAPECRRRRQYVCTFFDVLCSFAA